MLPSVRTARTCSALAETPSAGTALETAAAAVAGASLFWIGALASAVRSAAFTRFSCLDGQRLSAEYLQLTVE